MIVCICCVEIDESSFAVLQSNIEEIDRDGVIAITAHEKRAKKILKCLRQGLERSTSRSKRAGKTLWLDRSRSPLAMS